MKHKIEHIELMVINACQLSCTACATFSDLKHSGYVRWNDGKKELEQWLTRLDPECIGLMGGEPLMNPEIKQWINGIRDMSPDSQIRLPTNGLLLKKHMDIVDLLHSIGNCVLKISYHTDSKDMRNIVRQILTSYDFRPVTEYGINRWSTENNFKFQINSPKTFLKSFKNDYPNMMPHNNEPVDAFDICVAQRCPFLYKNKLFKCSTAGLTPEIHSRFGSPNAESWQNYLDTGLAVNCADSEIKSFIANFGKPHKICRQCPSAKDTGSIIDHQTSVIFK